MPLDKEIVDEFLDESRSLISEIIDLLMDIEDDFSQVGKLSEYGNKVDRIMGAAKSLALMVDVDHPLHMISDYAALCKAVGYQASQIKENPHFFDICVALLADATEMLNELINNIDKDGKKLKESIPEAFIERLRWVSTQFNKSVKTSVSATPTNAPVHLGQSEIDDLLAKLGL